MERKLKKHPLLPWWPVLLIGFGGLGAAGAAARGLSLEEALDLVLAQSAEVRLASAGVEQAAAEQLVARSQLYPQISATAGYTRTLKSQYSGLGNSSSEPDSGGQGAPADTSSNASFFDDLPFGQKNQYSLGLSLSQNLFAGGRLVAQKRAANARYRSASLQLAMARAQALLEVTRRYYDALLAEELALIADSSLVQAEGVLSLTETTWKEGQKSEYELLRARVVRDNQLPLVLQRHSERDQAHLRLKELLALALDDSLSLTTGPETPLPRFALAADTSAARRVPVRQAQEG
ncbi:MAG: TolC family protein, partial [Candidatus Latescibacteria bacterium]|nr:TolC family protein [Candidatus Latescibacterota bacterium]